MKPFFLSLFSLPAYYDRTAAAEATPVHRFTFILSPATDFFFLGSPAAQEGATTGCPFLTPLLRFPVS